MVIYFDTTFATYSCWIKEKGRIAAVLFVLRQWRRSVGLKTRLEERLRRLVVVDDERVGGVGHLEAAGRPHQVFAEAGKVGRPQQAGAAWRDHRCAGCAIWAS